MEPADEFAVPHSSLKIVAYVEACSAISDGEMEVIAENESSRKRTRIFLSGDPTDSHVAYEETTGTIVINVPNLIDIQFVAAQVDGNKIKVNFMPKDDPARRAAYLLWLNQNSDPRAPEWFKFATGQTDHLPK